MDVWCDTHKYEMEGSVDGMFGSCERGISGMPWTTKIVWAWPACIGYKGTRGTG